MRGKSDVPGPGEQNGPVNLQEEATRVPAPDGDYRSAPEFCPPARTRDVDAQHQETQPAFDSSEGTAVPGDAPLPPAVSPDAHEQRLDRSAGDLDRETVFDPAQDLSIPPSDRL